MSEVLYNPGESVVADSVLEKHNSEVKSGLITDNDPLFRSGVEWIGGGLALIHENIPLTNESQIALFGEVVSDVNRPRFDYVNLATDEIAPDPKDIDSMTKRYQEIYPHSQTLIGKMADALVPSYKRRKATYMENQVKSRQSTLDSGYSRLLEASSQKIDIFSLLSDIFYRTDRNQKVFLEQIKIHQDKPFLIIDGHGGEQDGTWIVGEGHTPNVVDIELVLNRMGVGKDKYSAIILVACNNAKLSPPKLDETSIFYVDGPAGIAKNVERIA